MKNIMNFIGEFLAAGLILGLPFYGSWIYYMITGEYLDFGAGQ